ncbi:MAG TPA: glycosyltransferase family 39 protein [Dehalococcoidia bacterium]|nr:glycosyltransferase family 39 protein [Dehalococcoidia bacterium]
MSITRIRRHAPALGLVLLAALALRVTWISFVHPDPNDGRFDDTVWYRNSAHFLALGAGYVNPFTGTPTAAWPPGYPAFLGGVFRAFGEGTTQTYAANAVVATATVAIVYGIGLLLFDQRTALVGAVATALWPGQVYFASLTLSEIVFTALFSLAFLLALAAVRTRVWRGATVVAFGLATAAAVLTRGQAALLLPLAVCAWAMAGMSWRRAIGWGMLAAVVVGAALAPWVMRNQRALGSPVIVATNAGPNLWLGHHEGATGRMQSDEPIPVPDRGNLTQPEYEVKADRLALRKGVRFILTHPADELRLSATKVRAMYESDSTALDWNSSYDDGFYAPGAAGFLRTLANGYWFAALGLAAVGVAACRQRLRDLPGILPLTLLAWTATHLLFFGDSRFHYPIVFIVALLAARGVVVLYEGVRRAQPSLEGRYAAA